MQATIRYAKSGPVHVAYQVFGDGALDLVLVPGFISRQFECCSRDGLPVEPKSAYSVSWRNARSKSGATGNALRSLRR
jgi:hypothetical protein